MLRSSPQPRTWDRCPHQCRWGVMGTLGPGGSPLQPSSAQEEGRWNGERVHQHIQGLCLHPPCSRCPHCASTIPPRSFPRHLLPPLSPRLPRADTGSQPERCSPHCPATTAAARGALEVPGATLGHPPGMGGKDRSPTSSPALLCKLFAKAFISAATPPCARVVATPSRCTGPSVASRHAARFLHRPLRKAPLYPRFGGFLFFSPAVPGHPIPGRYAFTKALSCVRSLLLQPGPCTDAPWDGSGVQHRV
uniref:Uncharacterized protein n=1 Tax=Columba livia TaxID=8932 RepID=R7VWF3_COLLI